MTLSTALIELIHHVELHDSDWWQTALENATLFVLWMAEQPLEPAIVRQELDDLNLTVPKSRCQEVLDRLIKAGNAIQESGGYSLAEVGRNRIEGMIQEGGDIEVSVRERFEDILRHRLPTLDLDTAWETFHDTLLIPAVADLGVAAYELIRGDTFPFDPTKYLDPYLDRYGDVDRSLLLSALSEFLDPRVRAVRLYVLRQLTANFVIRAAGLDESVLKDLQRLTTERVRFECFVDTNVLFSALDLHDNPSDDISHELFELSQDYPHRIKVDFRVLPITLEEARNALLSSQRTCEGLVLTRNLAAVASQFTMNGLVTRFIRQAKEGGIRDANEYFSEKISNLLALCRNEGIELHNAVLDDYKVREDVATAIVNQLDYESRTRTHPKHYEQVEHDMVLWHFVRDRRESYVESPAEARHWVTTLDYRFIGFDSYRAKRSGRLPICIDPTALLQLLQFWIPRTESMERALVSSIRVMFLFQDFDPETERAIVRIMSTISRFASSEQLSEATVARMVMNDEMRRRMALLDDREAQVELVREELVNIEHELRDTVDSLQADVASARDASADAREKLVATKEELEEARNRSREYEERFEQQRDSMEQQSDEYRARLVALERSAVGQFIGISLGFCIIGLVVSVWWAESFLRRGAPGASLLAGMAWSGILLMASHWKVSRASDGARAAFVWVDRFKTWFLTALGGIVVAVLGQIAHGSIFGN